MNTTFVRVVGGLLAIGATIAVNRALRAAWRTTTKQDPPGDTSRHPSFGQAIAWTMVSAAAMAATQMVVRRGLTNTFERDAA